MSRFSMRLDTRAMRDKIREIRERIPGIVASGLKVIAERALEERYAQYGGLQAAAEWRGEVYGRLSKLDAVFVPVKLKHVRREQWPDLQPIFDARVRRKQETYMGRRRFWVDEVKLDALRRQQIAKRMRQLSGGEWRIRIKVDRG